MSIKTFLFKTTTSKVNLNDPHHLPFRYCCNQTGELLCTLSDVIKTTISSIIYYHFFPTWSYKKGGF